MDNAFHKFGRIHRIWIASYSPIFAFVEFDDTRQAENAIRELDGTFVFFSHDFRGEGGRGRLVWRWLDFFLHSPILAGSNFG